MSKFNTIKAEIDGNAGLYGAMTDQQVADELNAEDKQRNRTSMSGSDILESIEGSALVGLTGDDAVKVMGIVGTDSINPFGPAAQIFINAFGGGSATIVSLAAARVETGISQATIIGMGKVFPAEVNTARSI